MSLPSLLPQVYVTTGVPGLLPWIHTQSAVVTDHGFPSFTSGKTIF